MHRRPAMWTLLALAALHAERLPVKTYTSSDGLAHDVVYRITQDRRGFLWICTEEGLSRFDGYEFKNYTAAEGLPRDAVTDLLETRHGEYWVATAEGLYRFDPAGGRKFTRIDPVPSRVLLEDRSGKIWCGTRRGLYQLVEGALHEIEIGLPRTSADSAAVRVLLEDRRGNLWIGGASGLYRRLPDGRVDHYTEQHGLPKPAIMGLAEDREGRVWATTYQGGVTRLVAEPDPARSIAAWTHAAPGIHALFRASDGRLWAGGWSGAFQEIVTQAGREDATIRNYTQAAGGLHDVGSIGEDRNGDLWVATGNGAVRVARDGFTTFAEEDGLALPTNGGLFTDRAGEICGHFAARKGIVLACYDGQRFLPLWRDLPAAVNRFPGWGPNRVLQDRYGEWWIGTARGLYRFAKAGEMSPRTVYTTRDGLSADHIFGLHEDSRGDLWIAVAESARGLCRWTRATGKFDCFSIADGGDAVKGNLIFSMTEDKAGALWIGRYYGGIARYRDGRFTFFPGGPQLPQGMITRIYCDRAGRIWIATSAGGVLRVDDPSADRVQFKPYKAADGLPTDSINDVIEDTLGRIYLATDRGVCRLDPATGRIKRYTNPESGLPENQVRHAARDAHGALWFATLSGVARLIPSPDRAIAPPSVVIAGLRIAGRPHAIPELGEAALAGIVAEPQQNQFQIDFAGLGAAAGERLRYRYRLEGAGDNWSAPSEQRSVTLAGLAPGSYRFEVQALGADGVISPVPAILDFTIRPPLWRRWYFVLFAGTTILVLAYGLHRYRVARLIELERVRTRIATDLHDDIGSSLSQVAILSEVAREQIRSGSTAAVETAGEIAETARSMVDSMSDIVWSIDPRRDDLGSLTQRVRKFASGVFDGKSIAWSFEASDELSRLKLTPEQRRQIYLVLKEAVNNAARHAAAGAVTLRIGVTGHELQAQVSDNGRGFVTGNGHQGYGLESMRARVAQMNGRIEIRSTPGHGTEISLRVPL